MLVLICKFLFFSFFFWIMNSGSDMRKSVFDLFLGRAFEGPVEKKLRTTGEWLVANAETRFRSSGNPFFLSFFSSIYL